MLLRLAYLGVASMFVLLRLLPASDRDKVVEILALRHQIVILERQRSGPAAGSARVPVMTLKTAPVPAGLAKKKSAKEELLPTM